MRYEGNDDVCLKMFVDFISVFLSFLRSQEYNFPINHYISFVLKCPNIIKPIIGILLFFFSKMLEMSDVADNIIDWYTLTALRVSCTLYLNTNILLLNLVIKIIHVSHLNVGHSFTLNIVSFCLSTKAPY